MSIWLLVSAGFWLSIAYLFKIIDTHPLATIVSTIKQSFSNIAFIIMILFGYSHYMQEIGANNALVELASKPLQKIRYPYLLLMLLFVTASLLSVVITSAAALAVLLLGTFYPILSRLNISKPAIAAIIVSSAGIMPSPLAVETSLSAQALNMQLPTYILKSYTITIPMLLAITLTHGWWQWRCDQKIACKQKNTNYMHNNYQNSASLGLALLPFLPLVLFIIASIAGNSTYSDLTAVILISLAVALILESIGQRNIKLATLRLASFWQGMANGLIQVGAIVISAGVFVEVIKQLGMIYYLQELLLNSYLHPLLLLLIIVMSIIFTGIATGSGLALYFGLAPLVPDFAKLMQLPGWQVSAFLEVVAHSSRTFSFLAAVMIVTSTYLHISIPAIIKRTIVPVVVGLMVLFFQLYMN